MAERRALLVLTLALASCGGGGAPQTIQTADLDPLRLQFSVGTATFPASTSDLPVAGPILNLVETFRQPNGTSALLSDDVSLTGPASFVVTASNQAVPHDGGAPNQLIDTLRGVSAFGESMGVNSNGIATLPGFANGFALLAGGAPAFPRTTDGNYPAGFSYGAIVVAVGGNPGVFAKGFPLGTYTLKVSTPVGSGESHTWTASAKLASLKTLPTIAAPQVSFDGRGGGSVTFVVPARVTELFVSISAGDDMCWPFATHTSDSTGVLTSSGQFSLFVKAPKAGSLTLAIPDNLGPPASTGNAPTFCSFKENLAADSTSQRGGTASVQIVGVDYPLYEMSYPQSTAQLPPIAGNTDPSGKPNPQSDVTVSAVTNGIAP